MSCYSRAKLNLVRQDFSTAFETGLRAPSRSLAFRLYLSQCHLLHNLHSFAKSYTSAKQGDDVSGLILLALPAFIHSAIFFTQTKRGRAGEGFMPPPPLDTYWSVVTYHVTTLQVSAKLYLVQFLP